MSCEGWSRVGLDAIFGAINGFKLDNELIDKMKIVKKYLNTINTKSTDLRTKISDTDGHI